MKLHRDTVILASIACLISGSVLSGIATGSISFFESVECLRMGGSSELKALHIAGDGQTALAYTLIPIRLRQIYRELRARPTAEQFNKFAAFIVLCGLTHVTNILRFWLPLEWPFGLLKNATGLVSLGVYFELRRQTGEILGLGRKQEELEEARARAEGDAAAAQFAKTTAEAIAHDLARANEEKVEQLKAVAARDAVIREFGAPIMELPGRCVVVPLIGAIDPARAAEITHRITKYAEARKPAHVFVELTGVETVDTAVAHALHRLVRMLALQGVRCAATGVRADVARALVDLGVDDLRMPTYATLNAGLSAVSVRGSR